MKRWLLFYLLVMGIAGCDNGSGPSAEGGVETHPFFPYAQGDEYVWQVNDKSLDTTYTRTWKVTSYYRIDSHFYQMHVSDEYWHDGIKVGDQGLFRDTSFYRVNGQSVFIRKPGTSESLTIDFAATYRPGSSTFTYLKDTSGVVVPAGTFSGKIMKSDAARHVYSQGVGMIHSFFDFSGGYKPIEIKLLSAKIGGRSWP